MTRTRTTALTGTLLLLAAAVALTLVFLTGRSSGGNQIQLKLGSGAAGSLSKETMAGEGPAGGYEAYRSAARTYPANTIPPAIVARAKATFARIAKRDARLRAKLRKAHGRSFLANGPKWQLYGPRKAAVEPGVVSFSGATNVTASRTVALVADPDCSAHSCRLWAGTSGGGVWRTNNVVAADPVWTCRHGRPRPELGRRLTLDPNDRKRQHALPRHRRGQPLLLRLRGGRRHLQDHDHGGNNWTKLADTCVSNATYACVNPGQGRVPRAQNQRDPCRPDATRNHIYRRLRTRPSAAFRIRSVWRRRRSGSSPAQTGPACTSRPTAARRSPRSGTATARPSASRTQPRPARSETSSTRRRSTRVLWRRPGARRFVDAVRLPPGVRTAVPGRRDRPDDVRADRQERHDANLPDRRHRQRRRTASRAVELLADGQRQPTGRGAARIGGTRRDRAASARDSVPGELQRLAEADVEHDL